MSNGKLIGLNINVEKIPKSAIFKGEKGSYLSLDVWINDEEDKFGNHASANIRQSKEERDAKAPKVYVGNGKKVFGWDDAPVSQPATAKAVAADDDGDIPF